MSDAFNTWNEGLLKFFSYGRPARRDFIDQARSSLKPNSDKGWGESIQDDVKDKYDKAASKLQPDDNKGTMQNTKDTVSNEAGERRSSLMDKVKDTFHMQK